MFVRDERPPQRKSYFLLRLCFVDEATGEYTGRDVWHKLGRGSDIHQVDGYDLPKSVRDATALWAQDYAPKGGRPTKQGHEVVVVESEEDHPPPKGKAPTPSPKPLKVAKVASPAPPPAPPRRP